MSRVVVCGSLNMDVVVQSPRRPAAGETLLGATVSFMPGGKGLNQAVASARLGTPTAMVGAVGNDSFGDALRGFLADSDVDSTGVREVKGQSSGVALIQVSGGDNAITVASGANMHFTRKLVRQAPQKGEVWVAQFETPIATTMTILAEAQAAGARTVLNMAPMAKHPVRLLKCIDVAIVNEIELSQVLGATLRETTAMRTIIDACQKLRARGPRAVIATLGARGAVVVTAEAVATLPGLKAKVVDTTGAGDCFVGALASRLATGATVVDAARYAVAASSCAVEKLGAAPSMPNARQVAARLSKA
jgi:ribokinase